MAAATARTIAATAMTTHHLRSGLGYLVTIFPASFVSSILRHRRRPGVEPERPQRLVVPGVVAGRPRDVGRQRPADLQRGGLAGRADVPKLGPDRPGHQQRAAGPVEPRVPPPPAAALVRRRRVVRAHAADAPRRRVDLVLAELRPDCDHGGSTVPSLWLGGLSSGLAGCVRPMKNPATPPLSATKKQVIA